MLATISSNVSVWHAPQFIITFNVVESKHTQIISGFFTIVIELTQGVCPDCSAMTPEVKHTLYFIFYFVLYGIGKVSRRVNYGHHIVINMYSRLWLALIPHLLQPVVSVLSQWLICLAVPVAWAWRMLFFLEWPDIQGPPGNWSFGLSPAEWLPHLGYCSGQSR